MELSYYTILCMNYLNYIVEVEFHCFTLGFTKLRGILSVSVKVLKKI